MALIKGSRARKLVFRKIFHPVNSFRLLGHLFSKKRRRRVDDDAQLQLYARMFPGGYLHYGYFDDTDTPGDAIGFGDIQAAQQRYADVVLDQIGDPNSPVLDVGCGMGGLMAEMRRRSIDCVGLTPDRSQIAHIRATQADAVVEHARFEDIDPDRYRGHFGTVINSESLQYIDLDAAIAAVDRALKPGGRWIVIDYFRRGDAFEGSGHQVSGFRDRLAAAGYELLVERDVTANVLPTMRFAHLLGERLALPLAGYVFDKIEAKTTALNFVLEDLIAEIRPNLGELFHTVDPKVFARDKQYMLFVAHRRDPAESQ